MCLRPKPNATFCRTKESAVNMFKTYYRLVKPGIVYGNAITASAGFFLASKGDVKIGLYFFMLAGISLIVASACVFNNWLDRDIDAKMQRTKKRALVTGRVSSRSALIYGTTLGLTGAALLGLFTNTLALLVALFGMFIYVGVYSPLKRKTSFGTVIGSVAGAAPPVVGYTSVANKLDGGALLLFLILVCWQMPHFYAIAIYRSKEYAAAKIPVLPRKYGLLITKLNILFYILALIAATWALTLLNYTGYTFLIVVTLFSFVWLWLCLRGFGKVDSNAWARGMFFLSLVIIINLSVMLSLDSVLV